MSTYPTINVATATHDDILEHFRACCQIQCGRTVTIEAIIRNFPKDTFPKEDIIQKLRYMGCVEE